AMAWIKLRPMRPPAPATISRMSDMVLLRLNVPRIWRGSRLRTVVAFDDDEIELALAAAQRRRGLVVGRAGAGERGLEAREFEHARPTPPAPSPHPARPAAHQEARAELAEGHAVRGDVGLVAFGVGHIDMPDPIALAGGCSGRPRPARSRERGRLRPVVALDDDEVASRMRQAQRPRPLVLGRAVAGERRGVVRKLAQHIARATPALDHLAVPTPYQDVAVVLAVRLRSGGHIGLVAFRVAHIEVRDPVTLGHGGPPCHGCVARSISATMAAAAACGSGAATIGRPTTR